MIYTIEDIFRVYKSFITPETQLCNRIPKID